MKRTAIFGILTALVALAFIPAALAHAQDDELANPWIAQSQADATQPDSKKQIPTLSTYYAGDIEFADEPISASVSIDQVKGKLSGTWTFDLEDQGAFTGSVAANNKVKFSLTFLSGGAKCKIKLSGKVVDGINIMMGSARMHNCGKAGKKLGKGSFDLQNG